MSFDPNHPLHRASYALEDLKWGGPEWREGPEPPVTAQEDEEFREYIEAVLTAAGLDLDAEELREAMMHYARSYRRHSGLSLVACSTMFCDGVLHGIALAKGLTGEVPPIYRDGHPS